MNRSFSYFKVGKSTFDLEQEHLSVEKGGFLTKKIETIFILLPPSPTLSHLGSIYSGK